MADDDKPFENMTEEEFAQWPAERRRERRGFVSTVGRDERIIREYVWKQDEADTRLEQLGLWR